MASGGRNSIRKLVTRQSPFGDPQISETSEEILDYLFDECKILVIGAGGLGCELLKDLSLMGIKHIEVIDMDTIELSNLNRQFLFRTKDIGKSKAEVAAAFIKNVVPDCEIVAHFKKIQDFDASFYQKFNIIVCGLDSIEARRWINNTIVNLLVYDEAGNLDQSSVIPIIDGGTEGLQGNARVILPGLTSCIECNLDLYPPPVNYPLCTIANTPRLPEHCIEYARTLLWQKELPFGSNVEVNPDNADHINWIHAKAVERANEYKLEAPAYRFTQGVIKHTIPAVSSTNSCIAATCAIEAFKLITSCAERMNNYQMLNLNYQVYTYVFETEKKDDCLVCSRKTGSKTVTSELVTVA